MNGNLIMVMGIGGVLKYDASEHSKFGKIRNDLAKVKKASPKALIVRVNSPGGTLGASQEIYGELKEVREKGIKVVALMEDMAASGGLYICLGADRIVALAGTITGSIGVIIQNFQYSAVLERFKIKVQTIKSGPYKDIFSPTREMTPEEEGILKEIVSDAYHQFINIVSKERKIAIDKVKEFADGRLLTSSQAKLLGLIDEIGSFSKAVDVALELAKIEKGKEKLRYLNLGRLAALMPKFLQSDFLADLEVRNLGIPLWIMPKL